MKIKGFGQYVSLRYLLSDEALREATTSLQEMYEMAQFNNWPKEKFVHAKRELSITREGSHALSIGDAYKSVKIPKHNYMISVHYDSPQTLTKELTDFELQQFKATDLRNECPLDGITVEPSEFSLLSRPWSCYKTWAPIGENKDPLQPYYKLELIIFGEIDDAHKDELRALGDEVCFPEPSGHGMWTTTCKNGTTKGGNPEISFTKIFDGEISKDSEKKLVDLYNEVKEFLRKNKIWPISADMVGDEDKLDRYLVLSTLDRPITWFAPYPSIEAIIPIGMATKESANVDVLRLRPQLHPVEANTLWKDGKWIGLPPKI